MKTLPDPCARRALLTPTKIALIDVESSRVWRFGEIEARVGRIAAWLLASGSGEGARVAVLCQNTPLFFELLFAVARIGAILVPLNWRQTEAELAPVVADCEPVLLLHDEAHAALACALASSAGFPVATLTEMDLAAEKHAETVPAREWHADRPWYLLYTSGTTGKPKAVIQTPGMMLANAVNVQLATGIDGATQALNFLPLFHTAGINLHTLPVFLTGGLTRVIAKFDAGEVLAQISAGDITIFFGVPQVYQQLSLHPDFERADLSHVRHWGCGGAPISAALISRFLARGVSICNGMGMTETGPTVFFMDPAHAAEKIGSVGKPQLLAEVRLVDADGDDVTEGAAGELLFRGPGITPGYFNNREATAAAFAPGGWLRSGDVARRDADGFYFIVDRIKDMFISGGENVYPAEIEQAIMQHPDVLEAAVIGVADARWGEVGHAAVLPRPGAELDTGEVSTFLRTCIAAYKVPRYITVVDHFPRTAAGKIQKHVLRSQIAGSGT